MHNDSGASTSLRLRLGVFVVLTLLPLLSCHGCGTPQPTLADIPNVPEVASIEIGMKLRRPVSDEAVLARCVKELRGLTFAPTGARMNKWKPDTFVLKDANGNVLLSFVVAAHQYIRFRTPAGAVKACQYETVPTIGKLYSMNEWLDFRRWIEQYVEDPAPWSKKEVAWWIARMNSLYKGPPFPVPESREELLKHLQTHPVPGLGQIDEFVDYFESDGSDQI